MGLFGKILHKIGADDIVNGFKRWANEEVMQGIIGALAWMAWANKELKEVEKQGIVKIIKQDKALKAFKERKLLECFEDFSATFQLSYAMGVEKVKNALKEITGEGEEVESRNRMIVAEIITIGKMDGDFDKDEHAVAVEICNILSLSPASFGL